MLLPLRQRRVWLDPDAKAWASTIEAAGGTVSGPQLYLISVLITALKAAGVWTLLDRLWLFATENATQALTCLKSRAVATAVNSPTFTANRGYAGNGTTAHINSNFNPSTAGGNYSQNDAALGCWVETEGASGGAYMAAYIAQWSLFWRSGATTVGWPINQGSNQNFTFAGQTGLWVPQRTGANATELFKDGASVATGVVASVALENRNVFILSDDGSTSTTTGRLAAAFIGKSLTAPQQASFHAAMRAYMTAAGVA